jgi:MinD superfamily P-loop ATPase
MNLVSGAEIHGVVTDAQTGELLTGATIYIKELKLGTIAGLDGSYLIKNIAPGKYTITCSFISYQSLDKQIVISDGTKAGVDFSLAQVVTQIDQITVSAITDRSTENNARASERLSANTINIVSARAIELSPDLNVANVVQRMSGLF